MCCFDLEPKEEEDMNNCPIQKIGSLSSLLLRWVIPNTRRQKNDDVTAVVMLLLAVCIYLLSLLSLEEAAFGGQTRI